MSYNPLLTEAQIAEMVIRKLPREYIDIPLDDFSPRIPLRHRLIGSLGHILISWGTRLEKNYQTILETADAANRQPTTTPC